jgi:hypothetical protein
MQCIHERILSSDGLVGLEVILNIAFFILFSQNVLKQARRIQRDDCDEVYVKMAAMTTTMAGPRTVGLGCISPVQRLDEQSEASLL